MVTVLQLQSMAALLQSVVNILQSTATLFQASGDSLSVKCSLVSSKW